MNKEVGDNIGATLGRVLEVRSDLVGGAVGRCIKIRTLLDKPLVRWTNVNIGGTLCRVFFRYEKLADFCFGCGRLDHVDRDCKTLQTDGKKNTMVCGLEQTDKT